LHAIHAPDFRDAAPQRTHYRACEEALNSVNVIPGRGLALAAATNGAVYLHTLNGALVGAFGKHTWDLSDSASYAGARGVKPLPLLDPLDALCGAAEARSEDADGAAAALRLRCVTMFCLCHVALDFAVAVLQSSACANLRPRQCHADVLPGDVLA
jgi:hypothetical protein